MKMYCLIREDLKKNHQAVQGGHAIAQYFLDHGIPDTWDNGTMIFLGVENEHSLKDWQEKLGDLNHSTFIEPDFGVNTSFREEGLFEYRRYKKFKVGNSIHGV